MKHVLLFAIVLTVLFFGLATTASAGFWEGTRQPDDCDYNFYYCQP